jgi:hypothetical protein
VDHNNDACSVSYSENVGGAEGEVQAAVLGIDAAVRQRHEGPSGMDCPNISCQVQKGSSADKTDANFFFHFYAEI